MGVTHDYPVALVTGAARGLGAAVADRLVADGWRVMATDIAEPVHDEQHDAVAVGSVRADEQGGVRASHQADVSSPDAVSELIRVTTDRFGHIDAVVNNAGVGGPSDPVVGMSHEAFLNVLEVNLLGPFLVAKAAAPIMIGARSGGRIVNIGSLFGQQAVANGAAYCASKAGVAALTQSLALELARHHITVNTVAPGNMWTAMHAEELSHRAALSGRTETEECEALHHTVPLGRHGTGLDVAGAVAWLLSQDAAYVTGQTISVNGGVYLT